MRFLSSKVSCFRAMALWGMPSFMGGLCFDHYNGGMVG
jgi:hypothetical protein